MTDAAYHSTRFTPDPRRRLLWETLVAEVFQKMIPPDATVLELGSGYGEFINAVSARRRIAVDQWPGMREHLAPGVEGIVAPVHQLDAVPDSAVDFAFSSNCFEHVPPAEFQQCLAQLRRKLKPGATLTIVQPNYRLCPREYFDDYTHVAIYTDRSLADALEANGFTVTRRVPRFLPLTIKGRLPVMPWLIRLYLRLPFRPLAKQMMIVATR